MGEDALSGLNLSQGELLNALNTVQRYLNGMRDSRNPRLQGELCLLELCLGRRAGGFHRISSRKRRGRRTSGARVRPAGGGGYKSAGGFPAAAGGGAGARAAFSGGERFQRG